MGQPGATKELAKRQRTTPDRRSTGAAGVELGGDGLGLLTIGSDRMPAASLASGERVESVIGDDVEAVLALHDVGHRPSVDDVGANPKIGQPPACGRSEYQGMASP